MKRRKYRKGIDESLLVGKLIRSSSHSFIRWNERVNFPKFNNNGELDNYLQRLYQKGGIRHLFGDFYLIAEDIVVVADIVDSTLVIITLYGKQSENPMLYNIRDIIKNKRKYGNVDLALFAC